MEKPGKKCVESRGLYRSHASSESGVSSGSGGQRVWTVRTLSSMSGGSIQCTCRVLSVISSGKIFVARIFRSAAKSEGIVIPALRPLEGRKCVAKGFGPGCALLLQLPSMELGGGGVEPQRCAP